MIITQNFQDFKQDEFIISNYLELLEPSEKDKTKYVCPVCEGQNLSIHKNGKKYSCFDGCQGKQIAYKLRQLNGEFNGKSKPTIAKIESVKETEDKPVSLKTAVSILNFYQRNLSKDLAYNSRTKEVELKGKKLNLDNVRAWTAENYDVSIANKELAIETLLYLSQKNEFDPVKADLQRCYKLYFEAEGIDFDKKGLCALIFSQTNPLYAEYFYRWLIGIVARVYEPGCKLDEAFVLQGEPDTYKSTFFKVIGGEFFNDTMKNVDSNDSLLLLAKNWIVEWSEIDSMTAKTYAGTIKSFLSSSQDMYRIPYGRDVQRYPRTTVIVGSTNRDTFLNDPTGNRRFWVIPVPTGHRIPIEEVKRLRDLILGWAVSLYLGGESWSLPEEFKQAQKVENQSYQTEDPWLEVIEQFLSYKDFVTGNDVLRELENKGYPHQYSRTDKLRVSDILTILNWKSHRERIQGKQVRGYIKKG